MTQAPCQMVFLDTERLLWERRRRPLLRREQQLLQRVILLCGAVEGPCAPSRGPPTALRVRVSVCRVVPQRLCVCE